jgi:hypothetical protein
MATIYAPSLSRAIYQGALGNLSQVDVTYKANNVKAGDEVWLLEITQGVKVTGVAIISDELGAGASIELKLGDTSLIPATSVEVAGQIVQAIKPVMVADAPLPLALAVSGAAITGEVTVLLNYQFVGTL